MLRESKVIEISLPPIPTNAQRMDWRREILARAHQQTPRDGSPLFDNEKVEVVVVFFLNEPESDDCCWPDIDNLVKDAHDALQGALGQPGKTRDHTRVIRSDKQIYRLVAEKHHRTEGDPCGGRLIIRPYRRQEWPLQ